MQIAVMGAGAMGSLFGGLLAAAGEDVTLITRDAAHVRAITDRGLRIVDATDGGDAIDGGDGEGADVDGADADGADVTRADADEVDANDDPATHDRLVSVPATTDPASVGTVDLVLVFTKSHATAEAMADATPLLGPETVVLTLQNGLGNAEAIAEHVHDRRVLVGVTTHGAVREAAGLVQHTGAGDTALGWWRERSTEGASADDAPAAGDGNDEVAADDGAVSDRGVATRLTAAGIPTEVVADPERVRWEKLLVNVGINAPTALARVENGALARANAGRRLLRTAVTEAERVARAQGHDVREDVVAYALDVAEQTASNRSSMRVDLEAGRQTEVESLYGAVIGRAESVDVDVPVLRTLADLVRLAERSSD